MRMLNASAIKSHALLCSEKLRGGKFTRVSESFVDEIQLEVETLIRSFDMKYPPKTHEAVTNSVGEVVERDFVTGYFFDKLQPILDRAIARLIQRRVEQHPSIGSTLQGK